MNWAELQRNAPTWVQPSGWKMNYELRAGDAVISTLRFKSSFGTLATGENADGCWTFKRVGFCQTRVTIRMCGSDAEIATFRHNTWTGGGTLEFQDGRKLLVTTNFWQTQLTFQEESGRRLLGFQNKGVLKVSSDVHIEPDAFREPGISWMVLFGWYVIVMMQMDATVASSGGAVSS